MNPDERAAEIEEASRGLDAGVLAKEATKLSKWQIAGIQDYKRVGLTLRETAKQLRLPPSTIYPYFKAAPGPVSVEADSPGASKLGKTPAVPLDNPKPKERRSDQEKKGEKPELTSTEEKQKLETETNSTKRFNESESASSDLAPEE